LIRVAVTLRFVAHDRCEIVAVELDCPAVGVSIDAGDRDDASP
jgi:hypothetical protein